MPKEALRSALWRILKLLTRQGKLVLQPLRDGSAKLYQVRQVRSVVQQFGLGRKTMKYEVIMWWSEEDQAYLAEVPELPGCMADGLTHEELLRNLDEVVRLWMDAAQREGQPIPTPKGRLRYA